MDNKTQIAMPGGNYTPSDRASKAASSAKAAGSGSRPVVSDAPSSGGLNDNNDKGVSGSGNEKTPPQNAGGKAPAEKDQGGTDKLASDTSIASYKA